MKRKSKNNPLHLISLNVRGLRNNYKKRKVFKWFQEQNVDIVLLQETHFDKKTVNCNNMLWKGEMYHSFGTTNSKGVSILLKRGFDTKDITCKYIDEEGRIIILSLYYNKKVFNLINVYAPNNYRERALFFKKLEKKIATLCDKKE